MPNKTIYIQDETLWNAAKDAARGKGVSFSEYVCNALEASLAVEVERKVKAAAMTPEAIAAELELMAEAIRNMEGTAA